MLLVGRASRWRRCRSLGGLTPDFLTLFYFVSARGVGGGVWLMVNMRIFQASPSRT